MSVTLYDRALTEKIKSWVLDADTTILSPEETTTLLRIKADKREDAPIQLPLITIKRGRDITIREAGNHPRTREGKVFNSGCGISDHLNAVPVNINYTINIYARTLEQADEYVRNFVFNFINYPRMRILIPYNDSMLAYKSYITLQDTITDNSDIPERIVPGMFFRMTLSIALNDAYLFSYNHRKIPKVVSVIVEFEEDEPQEDTLSGGNGGIVIDPDGDNHDDSMIENITLIEE